MYNFMRKKKAPVLEPYVELAVMNNLVESFDSLSIEIRQLKVVELEAKKERLTIIKELQQLNASLEALSNKAD